MEQKIIKGWMHIPGLNQLNHSIVKALSRLNGKLIQHSLPLLPLPVRLKQPYAPVAGVVGIVFILVKSSLLRSVENAQSQRDN